MKLADVRKLTVKKQLRVRFPLPNGMECVVDEHGIARVPALQNVPDFNLEDALGSAAEFSVEPAAPDRKARVPRSTVSRDALAAMAAGSPDSPRHDEHEE